jgi:hypothetical protein
MSGPFHEPQLLPKMRHSFQTISELVIVEQTLASRVRVTAHGLRCPIWFCPQGLSQSRGGLLTKISIRAVSSESSEAHYGQLTSLKGKCAMSEAHDGGRTRLLTASQIVR